MGPFSWPVNTDVLGMAGCFMDQASISGPNGSQGQMLGMDDFNPQIGSQKKRKSWESGVRSFVTSGETRFSCFWDHNIMDLYTVFLCDGPSIQPLYIPKTYEHVHFMGSVTSRQLTTSYTCLFLMLPFWLLSNVPMFIAYMYYLI